MDRWCTSLEGCPFLPFPLPPLPMALTETDTAAGNKMTRPAQCLPVHCTTFMVGAMCYALCLKLELQSTDNVRVFARTEVSLTQLSPTTLSKSLICLGHPTLPHITPIRFPRTPIGVAAQGWLLPQWGGCYIPGVAAASPGPPLGSLRAAAESVQFRAQGGKLHRCLSGAMPPISLHSLCPREIGQVKSMVNRS